MTSPHEIVNSIGGLTYGGIFITALLANIVIPIPEEIVLLAIGYVASVGDINIFIALPLTIAGLFISDVILHLLAKRGNRHLRKVYARFQKSRFARYEDRLRSRIKLTIFCARFVTSLRFVGPVLSGMMKVPFKVFAIIDLLAIVIYASIFIIIGYVFHSKILLIIAGVQVVGHYIFVIIITGLATGLVFYLNKKFIVNVEESIKTTPLPDAHNSEEAGPR